MMRKHFILALGLCGVALVTMGQSRRVIRGSSWFESNVSTQPDAASVRAALAIDKSNWEADGATNSTLAGSASAWSGTFSNGVVVPSGGTVGVGTASPADVLHVKKDGGFVLMESTTSPFFGFKLRGGGSTDVAVLEANGGSGEIRLGSVQGAYFLTLYSANAEVGRINTSGNFGVGTTGPNSKFEVGASFGLKLTSGGTVTLGSSNCIYLINAAGQTVTLPTAVGIGNRIYTIKAISPSGGGTIATTSGQTIDGSTTYTLSANNKYLTVVSDGANWQIIANN